MHRRLIGLSGMLLALPWAPAQAQGAPSDVQCLMVGNLFASAAKEPKAREAASAARFFYHGRLDGRMSSDQIRQGLEAQRKAITPASAGGIMERCLKTMQGRLRALQQIAEKIAPAKK